MPLTFPVDPVIELYMNGWTDITTRVRQTSPITVTRGRADERGAVGPSKCTMVLNNNDGAFTPDNPTSPYNGLFSRNTPLRYSFRVCKDTFTRTVSNGWGSTSTGQAWSTFGASSAASDWNVGSGVGTHSIDAVNESRISYLATESYKDVDVTASFQLPFSNVTGDQISCSIILRGQSTTGPWYRCVVQILASEVINLFVVRNDGASDTTLEFEQLAFTHSGQSISIRAQAEGNTIRAKAWATSATEPYGWDISISDPLMLTQTAGWVGLRSFVGSTNANTKPIVVSWDNVELRSIRYSGEIATISPQSNAGNTDKVVAIEAAGLMRRLAQGRSQPKSPIERYVLGHFLEPLAYWPLDDGENALTGRVARGSMGVPATSNFIAAAPAGSAVPGRFFGNGQLATWLGSGVRVSNNSFIRCGLSDTYSGDWAINCAVRFDGIYTDVSNSDNLTFGEPFGAGSWLLDFNSATQEIEVVSPAGNIEDTITADIYDGACHHIGFDAMQSGPNVNWALHVDGAIATSGALIAATNVPIARLAFFQSAPLNSEDTRERAIGHVIIYGIDAASFGDVSDAIHGHPGETAGERIQRVCEQDGILADINGLATATAAMGPQRTVPTMDILQECADADLGTLYEPRGVVGVAYRPRVAIENQAAALALTYTSGHISPPFDPAYDDQNTRNAVTATRSDGGKITAIRTTGPLNSGNPGDDPEAVGIYDESVTVNVETDDQLTDVANWMIHLGTVKEPRFTHVHVDVANSAVSVAGALSVDVDDRITIASLQAYDIPDTLSQLARGMTEMLDTKRRLDITFNTAPESPYHVFTLDNSSLDRLDSDDTTLNEDLDTTETGVDVAIAGTTLWSTSAGEWPFDIMVGGERMTVTAVSGASSPQTFTVTRSVNGVVKTHSIGDPVYLADPIHLGL